MLKVAKGDWQQIRVLSAMYKELLIQKEEYVSKAAQMNLTPHQKAEVEVRLATISAQVIETDAQIHCLMFGCDEAIDVRPRTSLQEEFNRVHYREQAEAVKNLLSEVQGLKRENMSLLHRVYNYNALFKNQNNKAHGKQV